MSLRLYTILFLSLFLLILFLFSILASILICITQSDFKFWFLYLIRTISHIFESYNIIMLMIFFISYTLITYRYRRFRNIFFTFISILILVLSVNIFKLKSLFIYKNEEVDKNFFAFLISYIVCSLIWNKIAKKIWNLKLST